MKVECCLDLGERLENLYRKKPCLEEMIEGLKNQAGFKVCHRIYIGTSFCGQYFLNIKEDQILGVMGFCKKQGIKVSLVLPIFTQKNLEKGKKKIKTFEAFFVKEIDEIVVNDYGMLRYIHETYGKQINLVMGRLFMKDYREVRYQDYFNTRYQPKIFGQYIEKLVKQYEIKGMLFDATHKEIDFSHKPQGITIGVYEPYTYMTVGQICEIGSRHLPIEKKFRPNGPCQQECTEEHLHYFMEDGRKWLRVGKAVYFENRNFSVVGLENLRRIYSPFDEEVEA